MTGKIALTLATLVHSLLKVSIFLEQPLSGCSPAPGLANWIFFISMIILIRDIEVYPSRYACIPNTCRIIAEFVIVLLLMEFGTVIMWCPMERVFYKLMKCILMENSTDMYYDMGGDGMVGFLIIMFSFFILGSVSLATGFYYDLKLRLSPLFKICCDKKKRVLSRISASALCQAIPRYFEIDSECQCQCPHIQTRRRAFHRQNCIYNRRAGSKSRW